MQMAAPLSGAGDGLSAGGGGGGGGGIHGFMVCVNGPLANSNGYLVGLVELCDINLMVHAGPF